VQATRERILHILKENEEATVDDLSQDLGLTPVTVRHHLDILRGEGLVAAPVVRRRKAPGRPQHVYTLTDSASKFFPKRYDQLANLLLDEMQSMVSPADLDAMMARIGGQMAEQFTLTEADCQDFRTRISSLVDFLNERGYLASWENRDGNGYLIHVANCPFEKVSERHHEVCIADMTLLTDALGTRPERVAWAAGGEAHQCSYAVFPPDDGADSETA
jgi:predicted ArsR family transcriptional regulator